MKISAILLFTCVFSAYAANANSQNAKVNINGSNLTIGTYISQVEEQTDYLFVYSQNEINKDENLDVESGNKTVSETLHEAFDDTDIKYSFENDYVILTKKTMANIAQQAGRNISGVVTDVNGEPIIGANVTIKGQNTGTITDIDGKFSLNVPEGAVLVVSFIGYTTKEEAVAGKSQLTVVLSEDTQNLEEVVVVGYGTQKKVNLTGAISTVNFDKEAKSRPITSVASALAGMSAGMQVRTTSSNPGSEGNSILIRGNGTLNSSSPLVLVDGIESSLSYVNANDIQSISVLKDAASSAIYGNRAANGVILITTKTGEEGKVNVNYSAKFSFNSPMNKLKFMTDYASYMEYMNESMENIGQTGTFQQSTIDTWRNAAKNPNA
ncbi:MAG: carboxypeptidase-like regulatory domain-containing protein, partial [Bacteroidales bacterium]|nr:carboxypeptidase-like regulatory domain-containing protein [Bacteroidales bacterium]